MNGDQRFGAGSLGHSKDTSTWQFKCQKNKLRKIFLMHLNSFIGNKKIRNSIWHTVILFSDYKNLEPLLKYPSHRKGGFFEVFEREKSRSGKNPLPVSH